MSNERVLKHWIDSSQPVLSITNPDSLISEMVSQNNENPLIDYLATIGIFNSADYVKVMESNYDNLYNLINNEREFVNLERPEDKRDLFISAYEQYQINNPDLSLARGRCTDIYLGAIGNCESTYEIGQVGVYGATLPAGWSTIGFGTLATYVLAQRVNSANYYQSRHEAYGALVQCIKDQQ